MNRLNQVILEGTVSGDVILTPNSKHCKMIIPTTYTRTTKDTVETLDIAVEYHGHLSQYKMKFFKVGRGFRVAGYLASRIVDNKTIIVLVADYIEFKPSSVDNLPKVKLEPSGKDEKDSVRLDFTDDEEDKQMF